MGLNLGFIPLKEQRWATLRIHFLWAVDVVVLLRPIHLAILFLPLHDSISTRSSARLYPWHASKFKI